MRIWLHNFVSIQPRASLEKSHVSWPTAAAISDSKVIFAKLYRGKPGQPWQLLGIGKPEDMGGCSSAPDLVPKILGCGGGPGKSPDGVALSVCKYG